MRFELIMTIVGFLSGATMYSYYIPKWVLKKDIRENTTDENPGGYNAFSASKSLGTLCILLDILKGLIPVYIFVMARGLDTPWIMPIVIAPVLGHAFTPFLKGKGGKCLSTALGSILGLMPKSSIGILLVAIAVFFSFVVVINPFSMRVITGMMSFNVLISLLDLVNFWLAIGIWVITGLLFYKQIEKKSGMPLSIEWGLSRKNMIQ